MAGALAHNGRRVDLLFFVSPGPSPYSVPATANIVDLGAERSLLRLFGFLMVRHGDRHTGDLSEDWFLAWADSITPGWNPALADLGDLNLPHPVPSTRRAGRRVAAYC